MEFNRNHIIYSSEDIQRYLDGNMPPLEMNALEKAALDDPFLAEALEGYEQTYPATWESQVNALREHFAGKQETTVKVIPLTPVKQVSNNWWKYAAAILILGGGIGSYFLMNNKPAAEKPGFADNTKIGPVNNPGYKSEQVKTDTSGNLPLVLNPEKTTPAKPATIKPVIAQHNIGNISTAASSYYNYSASDSSQTLAANDNTTKPSSNYRDETVKAEDRADDKKVQELKEVQVKAPSTPPVAIKDNNDALLQNADKRFSNQVTVKGPALNQQNTMANNTGFSNTNQGLLNKRKADENLLTRSFTAQVVGPDNNPLPFANINITNQGFGTYADVNGNVRLQSTDSIIPIEVKSLGYETQLATLQSRAQVNRIMLKPQAFAEREKLNVTASNNAAGRYKKYAPVQLADSTADAEPADGWDNYNTYVINNLETPQEVLNKNIHGDVEVSFDVKKNGAITNIKVDKSLCNDCDEIAKRLVQQGPQWKVKKGKKAKARIRVQF